MGKTRRKRSRSGSGDPTDDEVSSSAGTKITLSASELLGTIREAIRAEHLATDKTMNELETRVEDLLVPLDVAVIGCVVNGPGEAKEAHIGLTGGSPNNLVYIDGKPASKLTNENLVDELEKLIRDKAAEKVAADAAVIVRG